VGSEARTSTWLAGYSWPPTATTFGLSLSLVLANSLIRRPAAPGSSVENAYSSGPTSASLVHSNSVPSTARATSVFLTTFRNTPFSRAFLRIAVICSTVVPAYSAAIRRSEEHTSELQSRENLVCRLLLEKRTAYTQS